MHDRAVREARYGVLKYLRQRHPEATPSCMCFAIMVIKRAKDSELEFRVVRLQVCVGCMHVCVGR